MSIKQYMPVPREHAPLQAQLIVKPDVLRVSLSVSLESEEPSQALPLLRRACEQLQRRAQERLSAEVTFQPRDVRFNRAANTHNKLSLSSSGDDDALVVLEGLLESPLGAELDFWTRSARLISLVRACQEAEADSRQSKKLPRFGFGNVEARVARPESHREELLRRFVARAQETATALGSSRAPLLVVEGSPAGAVEQTPHSLEEVGLSLPVACRLGLASEAAQGTSAGG